MKQLYRILPLVLGVGMVGCNNANQPETTANDSSQEQAKDTFVSSLPDDAPVLKVATTGNLAPYSMQDDYGNMQGIDIDIIRAIGEDQGFKVEFYKETWQELFDSVASGERDLAISGISYNDERNEKYGLSMPYYFNPSAIMYKSGEHQLNTLSDLKGLRVGVLEGAKQAAQMEAVGGQESITGYATGFLLYENLVQDNIDAALLDAPILQYTAKNHPEYKLTVVPYEKASEPTSQSVILMAKDNEQLINTINQGIANIKNTDAIQKSEERWIGSASQPLDSTPKATEQAN
ncbi:substrate-binding periplasmic protein [Psychrobacter aestuarii]|uniref:Basic amino acid ABC transporter substrate-binding protein n=1 Tax=Psychrobacter aestuarii TaxID=556327 RepID=A0ABN0VKZ7_9GAMM|nr:transporter substrate-binding domain-containing protein [Psychrobacter aestuarii]